MKLEAAESKLQDLKSNMGILGKEAASAMAAVEVQQQRLTLQRLLAMVMQNFSFNWTSILYSTYVLKLNCLFLLLLCSL